MEEITTNIFVSAILAIVISFITTVIFNGLISRGFIKHYFDKKSKDHESELSKISEGIKFDFQRKIHDFSLYSTKRNEVYAELFQHILEADGRVSHLHGFRIGGIDSFYSSKEDVKFYFEQIGAKNEKKISSIVDLWDTNRKMATEEFRNYERSINLHEAYNAIIMARNYLFKSKLYLSEEVGEGSLQLIDNLHTLYLQRELPEHRSDEKYKEDLKTLEITISEGINTIEVMMKKELSIGNYTEG